MSALDRLRIAGFKSIREQAVELRPLNVLIGANGAGKSNFIEVFELLHEIAEGRLQVYVGKAGGAENLLHFGSKKTGSISLFFEFGSNAYECELSATRKDRLIFADERVFFRGLGYDSPYDMWLGRGHEESRLGESGPWEGIAKHVLRSFMSWRVYHFHDTSASARVKRSGDVGDNEFLRSDAGNLAAFLYLLRENHERSYDNIVSTIRLVTPFFDDFRLRPDPLNPDRIRLEWRERGSDAYFDASALSDGTLRFVCLATLLMQPKKMLPTTVLLDEPELGLHPYAIHVLASMLESASSRAQVIVSTQSVTLVNQLDPEDLLVVDREDNESKFRRIGEEEISSWLDEYALGELWEKNVLGGRPGG